MALSANTAPTVRREIGRICFERTDDPTLYEVVVRDRYGEYAILFPRECLLSLSKTFVTLFPESAE